MSVHPPLALDIDGTMTRPDESIDPRFFDILPAWEAPVLLATGKAFPYPIALCHFMRIPKRVVAENGGVICVDGTIEVSPSAGRIGEFSDALLAAGIDPGWGEEDLVNRWRETELAVDRSIPRAELQSLADSFSLEVIDSGYAYHVKDPSFTKGAGIERASELIGFSLEDTLAIGDSENDVSTFDRVGSSVALANADEAAKRAADTVLDRPFSDGTIDVLDQYHSV